MPNEALFLTEIADRFERGAKPPLPLHDPPALLRALGLTPWSDVEDFRGEDKVSTIANLVLSPTPPNRFTVVESGNGVGKSVTAAAIASAWMAQGDPAAIVTIAPCYDDQTEVLTNVGWKKFIDLDDQDQVACLDKSGRVHYEVPQERFVFQYQGEMIGYQNQLVDFLVTPNHRVFMDTFINRKPEDFKGKVIPASEAFDRNGRFRKIADWDEGEESISPDWAEFLGFWFAEGWAEFNPKARKYRITLTNSDDKYVECLLRRVGLWDITKVYPKHKKPHVKDYTIHRKELAAIFVKYGKAHTKRIPDSIRNGSKKIIRAFLKGFWVGDGTTDNNGSTSLATAGYGLAGDLQELYLRVGVIASVLTCISQVGNEYYTVNVWKSRGKFPHVHKREYQKKHFRSDDYNGWYKKYYDGPVYSVQVSDYNKGDGKGGIILVRRNGKYVWSGNTHSQVNNVLWRYIRSMKNEVSAIPGTVFETPRWDCSPTHYGVGLSPKRASAEDLQALYGYHNPRLLVILDEAPGLPRLLWEAVQRLVTAPGNRILALGNPLQQAGPFWEACNRPDLWNYVHISCLDHPNVALKREAIPGATGVEWVRERIKDHCTRAAPDDPNSFEFEGQHYQPDAVFQSMVLGKAPTEATDQLISLAWVDGAMSWTADPDPSEPVVLSLDPSRVAHGDPAALICRQGGLVRWVRRRRPSTPNPTDELAGWLYSEHHSSGSSRVFIEETGIGAGVVDRARSLGLPVIPVSPSSGASKRNLANKRAECWWNLRNALQTGSISLPQDDLLMADLITPKYYFDGQARVIIEPKNKIRDRLGRSPDSGDALAISFALPTRIPPPDQSNVGLAAPSRWASVASPTQETGQKMSGPSRWHAGGVRNKGRFRR